MSLPLLDDREHCSRFHQPDTLRWPNSRALLSFVVTALVLRRQWTHDLQERPPHRPRDRPRRADPSDPRQRQPAAGRDRSGGPVRARGGPRPRDGVVRGLPLLRQPRRPADGPPGRRPTTTSARPSRTAMPPSTATTWPVASAGWPTRCATGPGPTRTATPCSTEARCPATQAPDATVDSATRVGYALMELVKDAQVGRRDARCRHCRDICGRGRLARTLRRVHRPAARLPADRSRR